MRYEWDPFGEVDASEIRAAMRIIKRVAIGAVVAGLAGWLGYFMFSQV